MNDTPPNLVDTGVECPECGYNLTGAAEYRCPWCGQSFDATLLATATDRRPVGWPAGVVIASLSVASGAVLGLVVLLRRSQVLRLADGFVVLGVSSAAIGLLTLAVLTVVARAGKLARSREYDRLIWLAGWLSVAAGIVGATSAFDTPTRPLPVSGGMSSALFDFVLRACLFTLPAWSLLVLRSVSMAIRTSAKPGSDKELGRASMPTEGGVPFVVECMQRFDRSQIEQRTAKSVSPMPPALAEYTATYWDIERGKAATQGRTLYNGQLVKLVQSDVRGSVLYLDLEKTCFRDFAATNLNASREKPSIAAEHRADALGVSGAVLTSDGFLAWGRRSERVYYHQGYLQAAGGMLEQDDRLDHGRYDLFGCMARELSEELGMGQEDLAAMTIIGLVRDKSILQPELLFDVEVNLSRKDLTARFTPARSDGEHTAIEFLYDDPEGYMPFLKATNLVTPVAQALLLLHGRLRWGAEWYEQICYVLYGDLPQVMTRRSRTS